MTPDEITTSYGLREEDRQRILALFGQPQAHYTLRQAAQLTGMSRARMTARSEDLGLVSEHGLLPWEDVALLLYHRIPGLLVSAALAPLPHALPPLNHYEELTVLLPRWQHVLLDHVAVQETTDYAWTRHDALTQIIHDWLWPPRVKPLYDTIPGFRAAAFFPQDHQP